MRVIFRGRHNIWRGWRVTPVACPGVEVFDFNDQSKTPTCRRSRLGGGARQSLCQARRPPSLREPQQHAQTQSEEEWGALCKRGGGLCPFFLHHIPLPRNFGHNLQSNSARPDRNLKSETIFLFFVPPFKSP